MSAISRSAGATADRSSVSACRQTLQPVDEAIDVLVRLVHEVAHLLAAVRLQRACQHAGQCLEAFSSGVCRCTPALRRNVPERGNALGPVHTIFPSANGVETAPIEARDDGRTGCLA
jgi:hypothetical protein